MVRGLVLAMVAALSVSPAAADVQVDEAAVAEARRSFIDRMVSRHGFDRDTLMETLTEAEIDMRVLEAISRPAERVLAWYEYQDLFLSDARIEAAVAFWTEHAELVRGASERYRVDPELLVAILGIESFFGERTGRYRVLDSLATLAFAYPPRASFFAAELEAFLLLTREEGIDPGEFLGSYAGAMGAGQFIPSSYRAYAVDGDGDGRRDLWGNWQDVLDSVANYFKVHGWIEGAPVVDRATRSSAWSGPEPANSMELNETVGSLTAMGYVFPTALMQAEPATVLSLDGRGEREYWVGYHNFRVITRYNRSVKYALAAYQLAQAILAAMNETSREQR